MRCLPLLALSLLVVPALAVGADPLFNPPGASAAAKPAVAPAAPPGPNQVRVLLAPELETTLASPMAGRIQNVKVRLGQSFTAGQTLLTFQCDEQQARLDMAQGELVSARATLAGKRRLNELKQAGQVEVDIAAGAAEKAAAQVKLLQVELKYCSIDAPFSGRVVKLPVKAYQGVNQGAPLLEIVSDGPLKLRLNVPAKWIAWLRPGVIFDVTLDETGKTYKARITAVNGRIDAVSQTVEIEASMVQKAAELLPGMSGNARFEPPA